MKEKRDAIKVSKKSPDKLDRFRMHYLAGKVLNKKEQIMLAKYRKANSLLCLGIPRNDIIEMFIKEEGLSESQIYAIIRDSIKLYGDVMEVDKKGQRIISIEYYKELSKKAKADGDYNAAIKAQQLADELMGLFDKDDNNIDPKVFMVPVPMVFSNDVEVLKKRQRDELDQDTFAVEV